MAARSFIDSEGRVWRAWDVQPGDHSDWPDAARRTLPPSMSAGWLCFESDSMKRRLHPIPRGWERWSVDELRVRCGLAMPVTRRPPDPAPDPMPA